MTLKMPFFISPAYWVPRITISRVLQRTATACHGQALLPDNVQPYGVLCAQNCFVFAHGDCICTTSLPIETPVSRSSDEHPCGHF